MARLGDLYQITSGGTPSRKHLEYYQDGSIPWVKTGDLKEKYLRDTDEKITESGLNNSSARIYPKDTVLVAMYGATIGASSILKIEAATNQACAAFVKRDDVIPEFLYAFLESQKSRFIKDAVGGAQPNISAGYLKEIDMPLIPLEEQRRIAALLDKVSDLIAKRQAQLDKLDLLVKARFAEIMKSAQLGDKTTIEKIVQRVKVGFVGPCEQYYTDETGVPMVRTGNITAHGIDLTKIKYVTREFHNNNKKSQIHSGDLLIARHGSNGQANVYYGVEAQCLNAVIIVPDSQITTSTFLANLINSSIVGEQIENTLVGSTQRVINTKNIANLVVQIPNLSVQKDFDNIVFQTNRITLSIGKSLEMLEKLKKALMQQYFV